MNLAILITALVFALVSAGGAFSRHLPGPVLTYIAVLLAKWGGAYVNENTLWVTLVITILTVLSGYFLPVLSERYIGGTKAGFRGAAVTTIAVLVFSSLSIFSSTLSTIVFTIVAQKTTFAMILIAVALIGSIEGELRTQHAHVSKALIDAFGSTISYITGSGAKILYAAYVIFYIILDIVICVD